MNILFTICGRAGSKGVENKNITDFLGYPLVYYTVAAIDLFKKNNQRNYKKIDIAVNTDSRALLEYLDQIKIPYTFIERKADLATDYSSKIDVIRDTLVSMEQKEGIIYDYIIDLDLTSPLRTVVDIEALLAKIKEDSTLDVVFSVTSPRRNPYFNMVTRTKEGIRRVIDSNFTARQQAPCLYDMNASMYVYSHLFLKNEQKKGIFDGTIEVIEMKDTAVLDIDNKEDLELMQVIAPYFYNKYEEYGAIKEHVKNLVQRKEG